MSLDSSEESCQIEVCSKMLDRADSPPPPVTLAGTVPVQPKSKAGPEDVPLLSRAVDLKGGKPKTSDGQPASVECRASGLDLEALRSAISIFSRSSPKNLTSETLQPQEEGHPEDDENSAGVLAYSTFSVNTRQSFLSTGIDPSITVSMPPDISNEARSAEGGGPNGLHGSSSVDTTPKASSLSDCKDASSGNSANSQEESKILSETKKLGDEASTSTKKADESQSSGSESKPAVCSHVASETQTKKTAGERPSYPNHGGSVRGRGRGLPYRGYNRGRGFSLPGPSSRGSAYHGWATHGNGHYFRPNTGHGWASGHHGCEEFFTDDFFPDDCSENWHSNITPSNPYAKHYK